MRHTRSLSPRAFARLGIAAVVALVAGGAATTPAEAAPGPAVPAAASALATRLGDRSAGAYLDRASGRMVVTVTTAEAAGAVRAAGAVPRTVARGSATLRKATAALAAAVRTPGTAWAVDPATAQVVLTVDSTVTGARLARVAATARGLGGAVRVERAAGAFRTTISGGNAIYGGGYRCSLGFNVRSGSTFYFLTAGHCGDVASTWYANSARTTLLGTNAGSSFPGNDYAIVRYTSSVSHPGNVILYNGTFQDITGAGNAFIGQTVRRSGTTTGVRSGRVTAVNATVNYPEGQVSGLIRTTVCAEGGDSGGSLFAGTTALGLTSGGSGNCSFGGTTFFQPVTEALSVYGVSVY